MSPSKFFLKTLTTRSNTKWWFALDGLRVYLLVKYEGCSVSFWSKGNHPIFLITISLIFYPFSIFMLRNSSPHLHNSETQSIAKEWKDAWKLLVITPWVLRIWANLWAQQTFDEVLTGTFCWYFSLKILKDQSEWKDCTFRQPNMFKLCGKEWRLGYQEWVMVVEERGVIELNFRVTTI